MDTYSYSKLRANLKSALDRAMDDHEVITVKRAKGGEAVILSKDDYSAMAETAYLLRSPANAKRLRDAINRPRDEMVEFESLAELKNALGL